MAYIKLALAEYDSIVATTKQELMEDPNYAPEITFKRITDEVELNEAIAEDW
jgi:hypothetical protein